MKRQRLSTKDRDKLILERLSKMGDILMFDNEARREFIEELMFYDLRLTLRYRRSRRKRAHR